MPIQDLTKLTEKELAELYAKYRRLEWFDAMDRVVTELARRDA